MPTPKDPATDLANYISANNSLGFTLGTNLFIGEVRPIAQPGSASPITAPAVFVQANGGASPEPFLGSGTSYYTAGVRVFVRGPVGDNAAGELDARTLLSVAHAAPISGYVYAFAQQSLPEYLGPDSAECGIWVFIVEMAWVL